MTQFAAIFGAAFVALGDGLEVVGERALDRQHARVVGGQGVVAHEPLALRVGQLGQRRAHRGDERSSIDDGQEIGIREVAIVVRFLLAAHRPRLFAIGIVEPRLLHDLAAALDELDLPRGLDLDGLLDEPERVQVLELGARAELRFAARGAPTRSRRSGTSLPACCRRRSRGSARARGSCACRRRPRPPSADRARRRSRAGPCRRDSGRCPTCRRSPRAATCRRPPRDARARCRRCACCRPRARRRRLPPCTIGSSYWLI